MVDRFRRAIEMKPDSAACETCLQQLDDYIVAQLAGEDYADRFPQVSEHLDSCLTCASAYAHLYELEEAVNSDILPTPEKMPAPDLSFLPEEGPSSESLSALLSGHVQEQGERIRLHLSDALLALLRPTLAPAPTRSASRYEHLRYHLSPEQATAADLPLYFRVYADKEQPELALVEITVEPSGQSWPDLGGHTVSLAYQGETRQESTDAWGVAVFSGVPLDQLDEATVEVQVKAE